MRHLLIFLLFISLPAFSQKEAINWYFGNKAGLNFSNNTPVPLTNGAIFTESATAVMSDKQNGELLFYTNGRNIWNRKHQLMPGSDEFPENCPTAISQPSLIVPVPGQEFLYYVFSVRFSPPAHIYNCSYGYIIDDIVPDYSCEVRYSIVDMRLDEGMGDIVATYRTILLQTKVTEKLTAIPHSNGHDFWLITHEWNSNAFNIHSITATGIAPHAVQHIGSAHRSRISSGNAYNDEIRGMMKASPDGRKLACAVDSEIERPFDLFDFNPETGTLSNYVSLGNLEAQYGISFSPDNSKLYVSCLSPPGTLHKDIIRQYDLHAGSTSSIIASGKSIFQGNPDTNIPPWNFGMGYIDLQLGPDGKLYASSAHAYASPINPNPPMIVIGKPNEKGFSCAINYRSFDFGDGNIALGLPNFLQSYFNNLEPIDPTPQECTSVSIQLFPNPTSNRIKVSLEAECMQTFNLKVVNTIGQNVTGEQISLQTGAEVDLTGYAAGLYLLIFTFSDQKQVVKKVVKAS